MVNGGLTRVLAGGAHLSDAAWITLSASDWGVVGRLRKWSEHEGRGARQGGEHRQRHPSTMVGYVRVQVR